MVAFVVVAALASAVGCSRVEVNPVPASPGIFATREVRSDYGMVASGSIEATRAGVQILEQGGSAVDAAVAAALALGVADPGGSGLGGMTYVLMHFADGRAVAIDGTAPAPLAVDANRLRKLRESDHLYGYATAAVPTTLATLDRALERYGTMTMAQVLRPAIEIADDGYLLNSNHITWLDNYLSQILDSRHLRFVVLDGGRDLGRVGDRICRPVLAKTLRSVAFHGPNAFYRGPIAQQIEDDMIRNGGYVRRHDLALVRVRELRPLRAGYRGVEVVSFPPPGGGGTVVEALNILETFPSEFLAVDSVERLQVLVESFRIARADNRSFSSNPNRTAGHSGPPNLSDEYAEVRARLITPGRAIEDSRLNDEGAFRSLGEHTTHLSVVDRFGNAVSLTQTLGRQYGAKVATPGLGFPYNCLLEIFDYTHPLAPDYLRSRGRYPTDMAPTIILKDGVFMAAVGSAGSERVPPIVAQVVSNLVDRGMAIRDAVAAPRVLWGGTDPSKVYLEIRSPISEADADALERFGFEDIYRLRHPPRLIDLAFFGGVNAVAFDAETGVFTGVGDPRRSGHAEGPRVVAEPGGEKQRSVR
jgi:gamma-glutamyltranspeptidase/glutathione hydrolase